MVSLASADITHQRDIPGISDLFSHRSPATQPILPIALGLAL